MEAPKATIASIWILPPNTPPGKFAIIISFGESNAHSQSARIEGPGNLTPLSYPSSSLSPSGRLADAAAQESDPPIMPPAINGSLSPGAYGGHHQFHCNPHPPSPPRSAGSRRWVIHILWPVTTAKQPVAQGAGGICRLYVVNASCICRLYVVRVSFDIS